MNKRFLVAPLAAMALFAFAMPASAQTVNDELVQLKTDIREPEYRAAVARVGSTLIKCDAPDPDEVDQLNRQTTNLFLRAYDLYQRSSSRSDRLYAQMLEEETEQVFSTLGFVNPNC